MKKLILQIPVLVLVVACSILPLSQPQDTAAPPQPTQPPAPAATQTLPPPTETVVTPPELVEQVRQEESDSPAYTLDVKYPYLQGSSQSAAFNTLIDNIIQENVDDFLTKVNENEPARLENLPDVSSGLYIDYTVTLVDENLISLVFSISPYIAMMAHPGLYTRVVNFDLRLGSTLQLADLFLPNADYLASIATYCKDDLAGRDALLFPEGADPIDTNYQNWTVFSDSLSINFDPYQVAPWAQGPQQVIIPFTQLQDIIDPSGPLAPYLN